MTHEDFKVYDRDTVLLYNTYIVARIDVRNTYLISGQLIDHAFYKTLINTCIHLMNVGYKVLFCYCIDDEINLAIHYDDTTCGRMSRKVAAHLSSEASAFITHSLSTRVVCGIEIYELPTLALVADYMAYRQASCCGRIRDRHCLETLQTEEIDVPKAYSRMKRLSSEEKEKLVAESNTYIQAPAWHKHGTTIYKERYIKYTPDNRPLHKPRSKLIQDTSLVGQQLYHAVISSVESQLKPLKELSP